MRMSVALIGVLLACMVGCGKKESPPPAQTNASSSIPTVGSGNYLGALGQAKVHADKVIDAVELNKQVELFNVQEGRFPKDLNELVTMKYLSGLPTPPSGYKFSYDTNNGQVKVVKTQ